VRRAKGLLAEAQAELRHQRWEGEAWRPISSSLQYLGAFEDVAVVREDARVHIELYTGDFPGEISPCSEVERLVWFSKDDDRSKLAPVTRNKILPALLKQGLLS